VETTATYDSASDTFVIHSPTATSKKTWISQGCKAEHAVILAELFLDGQSKGPHLFWSRIATRDAKSGVLTAVPGVHVESLPKKIALRGLDNAYVRALRTFEIREPSPCLACRSWSGPVDTCSADASATRDTLGCWLRWLTASASFYTVRLTPFMFSDSVRCSNKRPQNEDCSHETIVSG
jgi:hypothetical protein